MDTMERIENKIDRILEAQSQMLASIASNTATQDDHERRIGETESSVKPLTKHVAMVQGALKLVGIIGAMVGILAGLAKAF